MSMRNSWKLVALGLLLLSSASCRSSTPSRLPSSAPGLSLPPPSRTSTPTQAGEPAQTYDRTPTATPIAQAVFPTPTAFPTAQTSSPTPTVATATLTPSPPAVTYSADGQYAFPVAGDLALMTWTHYHWDGSNAVDVEAARHLSGTGETFQNFINLPVVAVTTGTISIADNLYGGLALLLDGEDGYTYYYGHLSEQWVKDRQTVGLGDWLGRIGNTGYNTQYIEPHLHFSISTHDADDWRWQPDVNAAEQFLVWLDLPWQDLDIPDYPVDRVAGWPLAVTAEIARPFSEPLAENPDQGSIDLMPLTTANDPVPVYATLGGEVNVNRATVMGLRAQITNRPSRTTVVYSFLLETTVADGDVVQRGDLVGYIDPTVGLNYMLFIKDAPTDPAPTLGNPPQ